jgi:hypothetical protein
VKVDFFAVSVDSEVVRASEGGGTGVGVGFGDDTGSMKTSGGIGLVAGNSVIATDVNRSALLPREL